MEALGTIRDPATIPALTSALDDAAVSPRAAFALGMIRSPEALAALTDATRKGNEHAARWLATERQRLVELGRAVGEPVADLNPTLFSQKLEQLKSIHLPGTCESAVDWLGTIRDARAFYPLLDALGRIGRELSRILTVTGPASANDPYARIDASEKNRWTNLEEGMLRAAKACCPPELSANDVPPQYRDAFRTVKSRSALGLPGDAGSL